MIVSPFFGVYIAHENITLRGGGRVGVLPTKAGTLLSIYTLIPSFYISSFPLLQGNHLSSFGIYITDDTLEIVRVHDVL